MKDNCTIRPEGVIFDMDGVLFDTERLIIESWYGIAGDYGVSNDAIEATCVRCIGVTHDEVKRIFLEDYGQDFPFEESQARLREIFMKRVAEHGMPVKEGSVELLSYLKEQGIPAIVATSTRTQVAERELKDTGLYDYFVKVVGGDMAARSKPAPDIFLKAAEELGKDIKRCMVIEDSFNGIKAAAAAGARPVMVPDMLMPGDDIKKLAEAVLPSLYEVKDYIGKSATETTEVKGTMAGRPLSREKRVKEGGAGVHKRGSGVGGDAVGNGKRPEAENDKEKKEKDEEIEERLRKKLGGMNPLPARCPAATWLQ